VLGPRALRLTGELADGWVPSMAYVPPPQAAKSNAIIDEAARAAGREPSAIRRIYNIGGDVSPLVEARERRRPADRRPARPLGERPDAPCHRPRVLDIRPLGCTDGAAAADVHR
jgi:alkanesulfonate monooxygenase SsuD/methylene tetrahydromethanopterin reductase-like flavin-dependent oxidoreductase (luciferase family)